MNEDNNLSIGIRARILPIIEGADQLKSEISNLPSTISNRMAETIANPVFQEGLSTQQIKKVESLVSGITTSFEFEKIQEREKNLLNDYTLATESGKLTKPQITSYNKKFTQLGNDYANFAEEFLFAELNKPPNTFQQGQEFIHEGVKGKLLSVQEGGDKAFFQENISRKSYGIDLPQSLSQSLDPEKLSILREAAETSTQQAKEHIPSIAGKLEQINYANEYTRNIGKLEKEQFQRHKNLEFDLEEGGFTKQRGQRYLKEERAAVQQMEEMQQAAKEKFGDTEFGDRVFKTMGDDIEAAKDRMKNFADEIEKAGKGSGNLMSNLKSAGAFAFAGIAIDAGLRYQTKTEQVEARERTSFDFSSPLAMYNAREQNEAYKYTTERTRDYELAGGTIGAGVGALGTAAMMGAKGATLGPWGMVGGVILGGVTGYMTGSSWGAQQAELGEKGNITKRMEVEEELKFFNESYGTLSGYVGQSRGYDIERARTRARLGEQAFSSNVDEGLGYNPEERLRMRNSFADNYGKWDEKLYGEQTTFARAKGIDPEAIYSLNLSARLTGQNVGITGLEDARKLATASYGENVTSQRIIDVLNDLKNINEQMLDVNMNMDSREAAQIGMLPSLIFGKESPFGRVGDKAAQASSMINSLGQPGSMGEEAWLYNAYGEKDINKFAERKKLGITGSLENFNDIVRQMNRDTEGDEWKIERRLHATKDDKIQTAGIIPEIAKFIAEHPNGVTQTDFETFKNSSKFIAQTKDDYDKKAKDAVPESLSREEKIAKTINEAADKWRTTVYDMSEASTTFWNKMGSSAEYHELFMKKMTGTIADMDTIAQRIMKNLGIAPAPKEVNSLGGSDLIKSRFDDVRDKKQEKAVGWVKEHAERLREFVAENTKGEYLINLHEGYDPTKKGHAPNSPHYKNTETEGAMDVEAFRLNEQGKMIKIPKYEIPKDPALNTLFDEYAKENNIRWGGNFKTSFENGQYVSKPDPNHFDYLPYNGNKKPSLYDDNNLEHLKEAEQLAKKREAKEKPKQIVNRVKEFKEEILPPKSATTNVGAVDVDKLEHNKKLEELARKRNPQQPAEMIDRAKDLGLITPRLESEKPTTNKNVYELSNNDSVIDFATKKKEHSFFEQKTEMKQNLTFDYNAFETAFERVFNRMNMNNAGREETPVKIEINDRTNEGISAIHTGTASRNANSIFGGGH